MKIDGWFRKLDDGRLEIYLKVDGDDGRKIRASGPEAEMYELVDWFEEKTGLKVNSEQWRRVRKGPRPIEGQTSMIPELPSGVSPDA